MTRDAFIERIVEEVTEGRAIPIAPKKTRINKIIDEAVRYFHQNADEAHEFEYIIIRREVLGPFKGASGSQRMLIPQESAPYTRMES